MTRAKIFGISITFLIILLVFGWLFFAARTWIAFVPDSFGPIPVGVPWIGAVGAVLLSLTGVFEHENDWDEHYWPWHVARPLIGATLGIISVVIFKAGILAVGSNITPDAAKGPTNLLYYLIAFLVGYREETFRELIKRVADVILSPGSPDLPGPTITGVTPSSAPHATATQIVVTGSGFADVVSVKFGNDSASTYKRDSDTQLTVTTPSFPNATDVNLVVTTKNGSGVFKFAFT